MQITEPMTILTDYILAVFTITLAVFLYRAGRQQRQVSIKLWAAAFVATAIAAIVGGTAHGFALYLGHLSKAIIWKATVISIGIASFFMLAGTIIASVKKPVSRFFLAAALIKFLIYAVWMVFHDEFRFVIYDYAPAMFGVIFLQLYVFVKGQGKSAGWIIAGIFVSFAAAGIQLSGFTIHQHFNHNDLYHVIQIGAIYLLYKGACLLKDK